MFGFKNIFSSIPLSKNSLALIGLFVILAAIPLTVFLSQQQQEIRQRAAVNCKIPMASFPPASECNPIPEGCTAASYQWKIIQPGTNGAPDLDASRFGMGNDGQGNGCSVHSDCPQNTSDPSNVNPTTSNWCYEFTEGNRCIQLQHIPGSPSCGGGGAGGTCSATVEEARRQLIRAGGPFQNSSCTEITNKVCSDCTVFVPPNSIRDALCPGTCGSSPTPTPTPPTASLSGPPSGTVGQTLTFSANGQGGNLYAMTIARARVGSPTEEGSSWTVISNASCSGSSCSISGSWTPSSSETGSWYVAVNAQDRNGTSCSGNPSVPSPSLPGWYDCGLNDNIQLTVSPTPTSTLTPSPTPTLPPGVTLTPTPGVTLTPTPTPLPGTTTLDLSFALQGIGAESNPKNPSRQVRVQVLDTNNNPVKDERASATFQNGVFRGTLNLTGLTSGSFVVKLKLDNTLRKLVENITNITAGVKNTLQQVSFFSGDLNNDNELNVVDYAMLVGCLDIKKGTPGFNCNNSTLADLNDNGSVDLQDLSILIFNFSHRFGD